MIEVRSFTSAQDGIADKLLTPVTVKGGAMGMEVKAQWDTGATCTCIAEAVVDALGLEAVRLGAISSPTGTREASVHLVEIELPNGVVLPAHEVVRADLGDQEVDMLIGMDIIGKGEFCVSGYDGRTVFTFRMPPIRHTDYVAETEMLSNGNEQV